MSVLTFKKHFMNMKKYILLIFLAIVIVFLGYRLKNENSSASNKIELEMEDAVVENFIEDNSLGEMGEEALEETSIESGKVSMLGEFLDGDILKISVNTENIQQPVLGLAFHLSFDPEKLKFLRYDPGDFLEIGGDPFYLVTLSDQKDKIIFGETLRYNDSFPVGGGLIADFYFQIENGNEFDFTFEKGVVSTLDPTRQDIDKINWEPLNLARSRAKQIFDYTKNAVTNISGGNSPINLIFVFGSVLLLFMFIFSRKFPKNSLKHSDKNICQF